MGNINREAAKVSSRKFNKYEYFTDEYQSQMRMLNFLILPLIKHSKSEKRHNLMLYSY